MCPGRGVARRSVKRRRVFRLMVKSDEPSMTRRFKVMDFYPTDPMPSELFFELTILDWLEQRIFRHLENWTVPGEQYQYYIKFSKRLWERAVKFDQATFQGEKTILVNEFVLRGLVQILLQTIQAEAEAMAQLKRGRLLPPGWNYDNVLPFIYLMDPSGWHGGGYDQLMGAIHLADPIGHPLFEPKSCYDDRGSGTGSIWDPQGSNGGSYDNRQ